MSTASSATTADPSAASAPPRPAVFLPAVTSLAWREVVRFFRQRNRVIGAIATPVVFWLLLGFGGNEAFRIPVSGVADTPMGAAANGPSGVGYLEFFFPGAVLMMVLFTAIFSTITVIEDRKEGFLQSVLASPASRTAIVGGKVLGGAAIATAQGLVMLLIGALLFRQPSLLTLLPAVAVMFVLAVGLTALGLCLAPTAAAVCLYPLQSQCAVVRRNIPATRGLSRFHHPLRSCPSHQPCFPSWDQATISKWHRQIDRGFNAKGRGVRLESATRDTARPGGDCTNRGLPRSVRRGTRGWLRLVVA